MPTSRLFRCCLQDGSQRVESSKGSIGNSHGCFHHPHAHPRSPSRLHAGACAPKSHSPAAPALSRLALRAGRVLGEGPQVRGVKVLVAPAVDWCQQCTCFCLLALMLPEATLRLMAAPSSSDFTSWGRQWPGLLPSSPATQGYSSERVRIRRRISCESHIPLTVSKSIDERSNACGQTLRFGFK
jgi:hypothetical protein